MRKNKGLIQRLKCKNLLEIKAYILFIVFKISDRLDSLIRYRLPRQQRWLVRETPSCLSFAPSCS